MVPSPIFNICGRPHIINEHSDCGDMVVISDFKCLNKLHEKGTYLALPNTTKKGVSCESHFCRQIILNLLVGNSNILGLV